MRVEMWSELLSNALELVQKFESDNGLLCDC